MSIAMNYQRWDCYMCDKDVLEYLISQAEEYQARAHKAELALANQTHEVELALAVRPSLWEIFLLGTLVGFMIAIAVLTW